MKKLKRLIIILWLVCNWHFSTYSTNSNTWLIKADSCFKLGEYQKAALLYEHAVFATQSDSIKAMALYQKALCYKNLTAFTEVERNLRRMKFAVMNDSVTCEIYYERALALYALQLFKEADVLLMKINSLNVSTYTYSSALLLHVLVLNELQQWNMAKLKLLDYIDLLPIDMAAKLNDKKEAEQWYSIKETPHLKSKRKAYNLSKFLPSSGIYYAGYTGRGLTNTLLQLAAAGYIAFNIYQTTYITAATIGTHLVRQFYTGGVNQTGFLVEKTNYERSRSYNDKLKKHILKLALQK